MNTELSSEVLAKQMGGGLVCAEAAVFGSQFRGQRAAYRALILPASRKPVVVIVGWLSKRFLK